jgi:HSP20 family molecular chaperone IbpA
MSSLSSSLRYSSNLGTGQITTHPYDQRITDQGNKYIIQLKTDEYQENEFTITPRYSLNQLIIDGKHREEDNIGGYIHRELHKIFNIPKHIDLNRYTYSYNKPTQELTIEMPYIQTSTITNENHHDSSFISPVRNTTEPLTYSSGILNRHILPTSSTLSDYHNDSNNTSGIGTAVTDSTLMRSSTTVVAPTYESSIGKPKPFDFDLFHRSAFRPQIVRATSNENNNNYEKKILMSLDLSDYQAEDIKVSIKDRELIVQAERQTETGTRKSRTSFFQSTNLPPQTDIEHLQSNYMDGKLVIQAPYLEQNSTDRKLKTTNNHQEANW